MLAHYQTVSEFLRRLGHRVALVGLKPRKSWLPRSQVIWPIDQGDDPADVACWLSDQYGSVYANMNPLREELFTVRPSAGVSIRDTMISRRTRVLIDVDAHDCEKQIAERQKDDIIAELGEPLISADSGNGYGLIYAVDLPADAGRSVARFLAELKIRHSCVDESVHTLSRLTRVIGTPNVAKAAGCRIPTRLLHHDFQPDESHSVVRYGR